MAAASAKLESWEIKLLPAGPAVRSEPGCPERASLRAALAAGDKLPFGSVPVLNLTPFPSCALFSDVNASRRQNPSACFLPSAPKAFSRGRCLSGGQQLGCAPHNRAVPGTCWQRCVGPSGLRPPGAATAAGDGEELSVGCGCAVCRGKAPRIVAVCSESFMG